MRGQRKAEGVWGGGDYKCPFKAEWETTKTCHNRSTKASKSARPYGHASVIQAHPVQALRNWQCESKSMLSTISPNQRRSGATSPLTSRTCKWNAPIEPVPNRPWIRWSRVYRTSGSRDLAARRERAAAAQSSRHARADRTT